MAQDFSIPYCSTLLLFPSLFPSPHSSIELAQPTMAVDNFPAKRHIGSLLAHLTRLTADEPNVQEHIIFLQGEHTLSRHDTDRELPFRKLIHTLSTCSVAAHPTLAQLVAR